MLINTPSTPTTKTSSTSTQSNHNGSSASMAIAVPSGQISDPPSQSTASPSRGISWFLSSSVFGVNASATTTTNHSSGSGSPLRTCYSSSNTHDRTPMEIGIHDGWTRNRICFSLRFSFSLTRLAFISFSSSSSSSRQTMTMIITRVSLLQFVGLDLPITRWKSRWANLLTGCYFLFSLAPSLSLLLSPIDSFPENEHRHLWCIHSSIFFCFSLMIVNNTWLSRAAFFKYCVSFFLITVNPCLFSHLSPSLPLL